MLRFYSLDRYEQVDLLAYEMARSADLHRLWSELSKHIKESMAPEIGPLLIGIQELT